jgi:HSP20 family protein
MNSLRILDPTFPDSFESTLRRFFAPSAPSGESTSLKMRIDVTENDTGYTVKADIPGVNKENIGIQVDGNMVQIDAQTSSEKESRGNGDKLLRSERYYGTVSRSFALGHEIDESKVEAKYADGVLTLVLPKRAPAASSRIVVQ